jgi:hypothetical protein
MPIKLKSPLKKEFHLIKSDAELGVDETGDPTLITVRQATQGDHELRNDLDSEFRREYDGRTIKVVQRISFDDLRRREVFLTLCACNILDEDGKRLLFEFENGRLIDEGKFNTAWGKLPPTVADEMHEKVMEMNPLWNGSAKPPAATSGEASSQID